MKPAGGIAVHEDKPAWETVDRYGNTQRLKVPNGWLYVNSSPEGMCFVPDWPPLTTPDDEPLTFVPR